MLIPNSDLQLGDIREQDVRVFRGNADRGWSITSRNQSETLFSFDIPQEMFDFYADGGELRHARALDLKAENMGTIQLIITIHERVRVITLRLDKDWIDTLRKKNKDQG